MWKTINGTIYIKSQSNEVSEMLKTFQNSKCTGITSIFRNIEVLEERCVAIKRSWFEEVSEYCTDSKYLFLLFFVKFKGTIRIRTLNPNILH